MNNIERVIKNLEELKKETLKRKPKYNRAKDYNEGYIEGLKTAINFINLIK